MRRILRATIAAGLVGLAITFYLGSGRLQTLTTVAAKSLPGTATLSGTVDSSKPFRAGQVYIRNLDKQMLYMVYTNAGRFQAVNLFPGNYELSVKAKGLESDVQKLALKAGENGPAKLSMRETGNDPSRRPDIEYRSFEEIYPPGPGLEVAKRTCLSCHGASFLPSKQWGAEQWNAGLDLMMGRAGTGGAMIQPQDMTPQDREALLGYLVKNFGPGSKTRAVHVSVEMPVDETKISKAMYIEYYLATDAPGQGVNFPEYASLPGNFPWSQRKRVGQDVRFDRDGNVWLTDRGYPNRIVKLNPRTGERKDYLTPDPKNGIHDLSIDKDGMVWFPEHRGASGTQAKHLNMFNPKTEKWEGRYPLDPNDTIPSPQQWAQSLAIDSKGNVYAGWITGSALSKWDRETKKISVFPSPGANGSVYGVVADKNDNIWFAEWRDGKVAKFDPKTTKFTEYTPPTHPGIIRRLSVDSKNNIWFGIFSSGKLVKLDQATGKMTEYKIPHENSQPYDVFENAGNIWIADAGQGGTVIKFNPQDESFTYYPSPQRADKPKIQVTRDGAVWYSPRSSQDYPGFGVLFPDMDKITTLAAYY